MLPDGAWWYAEDDQYHWIDNFHTGYNLDSLRCYIENTGDTEFSGHLAGVFGFSRTISFSHPDARSITTIGRIRSIFNAHHRRSTRWRTLLRRIPSRSSLAIKVADWTIRDMQDRAGFFYYRKYPFGVTARTPMIHWGQATMFKGLAHLISRLSPGERSACPKQCLGTSCRKAAAYDSHGIGYARSPACRLWFRTTTW